MKRLSILIAVFILISCQAKEFYQMSEVTVRKPVAAPEKVEQSIDDDLLSKFNSLQFGMSYQRVCGIMGREGKLVSSTYIQAERPIDNRLYDWAYGEEIAISVMFENNSLITKGKKGLADT